MSILLSIVSRDTCRLFPFMRGQAMVVGVGRGLARAAERHIHCASATGSNFIVRQPAQNNSTSNWEQPTCLASVLAACRPAHQVQQRRWLAKKKEGKGKGGKKDDADEEEGNAVDPIAESEADIKEMDSKMSSSLNVFVSELGKLRTGRADPRMLDSVRVKALEAEIALVHCAQVTSTDPRSLTVSVFDPELVRAVDKAIREAGLDLNPQVVGTVIKVPIPKITQEVRQKMTKMAATQAESAKVAVRRIRQQCLDKFKKLNLSKDDVKRQEKAVQVITDKFIKAIDDELKTKQTELTTA